jgi:hypothetical protein
LKRFPGTHYEAGLIQLGCEAGPLVERGHLPSRSQQVDPPPGPQKQNNTLENNVRRDNIQEIRLPGGVISRRRERWRRLSTRPDGFYPFTWD